MLLSNKIKELKRLRDDQSGLTLIDMAIILMVIGILMVPALDSYKVWKQESQTGVTTQNFSSVDKAISDFYFDNGFYPCPANPALAPGAATYGDSDCITTNVGGGVLVGAVPFATLHIPLESSLDGWNDKLKYAVTQIQTTAATFSATGGNLRINGYRLLATGECDPAGLIDPQTTTAQYVILSLGESGFGARTADGNVRGACPAMGTSADAENCNDNNTFLHHQCAQADITGAANFYDDLVTFKAGIPSRMWTFSPVDPTDIMSSANSVGINNPNPTTNLDVNGNIRAVRNNTAQNCDVNGANCFASRIIAGYEPAMDCNNVPQSMGMTGVGSAKANCNPTYTVSTGLCAAGKYVIGIDGSGGIICQP